MRISPPPSSTRTYPIGVAASCTSARTRTLARRFDDAPRRNTRCTHGFRSAYGDARSPDPRHRLGDDGRRPAEERTGAEKTASNLPVLRTEDRVWRLL